MDKLDILNRKEFVEKLVTLTDRLADNKKNTSFAIDGEWGVGKSFVLDMYEEELSKIQSEETAKDKYFIIRYNCWKYDYYEEPLIAIVSTIIETIEQKTKLFPDNEKKSKILGVLKAVGLSLLSMANSAIRQKTGVDLGQAFGVIKKGIDDGAKSYDEKHNYDVYFGFNKAMSALQDSIKELSEEYTIVFLVDELDRCLPEYAIKVLERLHHLTENTKNIITVIAIDKTQLKTSLKNSFGFEADTYLKKFIEFEIKLGKGKVSEKFVDKYAEYVELFDKDILPFNDSIEEFLQAVFQSIGAREQEHLIERAMLAHRLLFTDKKDYAFMCMEILITVLSTCYDDIKAFSDEMEHFQGYIAVGKKKQKPLFARFFDDKIAEEKQIFRKKESPWYAEFRDTGEPKKNYYVMEKQDSLYGTITFIWYWLFLQNNQTIIQTQQSLIFNKLIESNIEELKKFNETIRFIK